MITAVNAQKMIEKLPKQSDTDEVESDPSEVVVEFPDALIDRVGLSYMDQSGEEADTEAFFARDKLPTGEHQLMFAMVELGVHDFLRCAVSDKNPERRRFMQTLRWIMSNDRTYPYSFVPLCEVLSIDVDNLRDKLNRWRKQNAPHSFDPLPRRRRRSDSVQV